MKRKFCILAKWCEDTVMDCEQYRAHDLALLSAFCAVAALPLGGIAFSTPGLDIVSIAVIITYYLWWSIACSLTLHYGQASVSKRARTVGMFVPYRPKQRLGAQAPITVGMSELPGQYTYSPAHP